MDQQGSTRPIQETIALILEVLPAVDLADKPYYEHRLEQLYKMLHDQRHGVSVSESSAMAGAFQPNHGHYMASSYTEPSYTAPSYHTQVPSPPHVEPALNRKRSLGPADYPGAKRVSGHPSPVTPTSPIGPWSHSLPSRQSGPIPIVDLTNSGPPTPDVFSNLSRQVFSDPFAELDNAYLDHSNSLAPVYAFDQAYMQQDELAAFLLAPTPPSGLHTYQPQPASDYFSNQQFPLHRRMGEKIENGNAGYSLVTESEAIEALLENIQEDDGAIQEREPTPAIMTCTLKEYQRIGLTWLLKMERGTTKGGILADEMGLGKTVSYS